MPTVTVQAPYDMKEETVFKVDNGGTLVDVRVPLGGVKQGQQFTAVIVEDNPNTTSTTTVPMGNASAVKQSTGPKRTSGTAKCSLACGIIGLIVFGIILGPIAIFTAISAKKEIQSNPDQVDGKCLANAGMTLGIIDIVVAIIFIVIIASSS